MNDFYVDDNCQTKIHSQGYIFTIAELMNIAICSLSFEELEKHTENNYEASKNKKAETFAF